jgi:hypothetical protein
VDDLDSARLAFESTRRDATRQISVFTFSGLVICAIGSWHARSGLFFFWCFFFFSLLSALHGLGMIALEIAVTRMAKPGLPYLRRSIAIRAAKVGALAAMNFGLYKWFA